MFPLELTIDTGELRLDLLGGDFITLDRGTLFLQRAEAMPIRDTSCGASPDDEHYFESQSTSNPASSRSSPMRILSLALLAALPACGENSDATSGDPGATGLGQGGRQLGLFRQILEDGDIPHPDALDDMGFFAEHKLDYPAPPTAAKTSASTRSAAR